MLTPSTAAVVRVTARAASKRLTAWTPASSSWRTARAVSRFVLPGAGGARLVDQAAEQRRDLADEVLLVSVRVAAPGAVEDQHPAGAERDAEGGGVARALVVPLAGDQVVDRATGADDLVEQPGDVLRGVGADALRDLPAAHGELEARAGTRRDEGADPDVEQPREAAAGGGQDLGLRTGPGGAGDVEEERERVGYRSDRWLRRRPLLLPRHRSVGRECGPGSGRRARHVHPPPGPRTPRATMLSLQTRGSTRSGCRLRSTERSFASGSPGLLGGTGGTRTGCVDGRRLGS